jgi:hypothetical protein
MTDRYSNIPLRFQAVSSWCRFWKEYGITLNNETPAPLVATAVEGFRAMIELTNPDVRLVNGKKLTKRKTCERAAAHDRAWAGGAA